jgi:hypothetical protein
MQKFRMTEGSVDPGCGPGTVVLRGSYGVIWCFGHLAGSLGDCFTLG